MIEISISIPISVYDRLQQTAWREQRSVADLLTELVSQRFPPHPSEPMWVKNPTESEKRQCPSHDRFVTDWTLPDKSNLLNRKEEL